MATIDPTAPAEPAPLSADRIVETALRVVDDEGFGALTMRRLGSELGVQAMSLYHHVPNKPALIELLVERVVRSVPEAATAATPDEQLEAYCRGLRSALHRHPNLSRSLVEHLPTLLHGSAPEVAIVGELVAAGFDAEAARWIVDAFAGFAIGQTIVEISRGSGGDEPTFETGLRFLVIGLRDELGV